MDTQPEDFEKLRRLLALKRHEQPPPGYFEGFSRQVFLRLQAGESDRPAGSERVGWEAPWLQRLWDALSLKPYLTGAIGVAACATVLAGVLYAERPDLPALADTGTTTPLLNLPDANPEVHFNTPFPSPMLVSSSNGPSLQPTMPNGLFQAMPINPELINRRPLMGN